jgi:hypothetical protein
MSASEIYVGSKTNCEAYNNKVNAALGYPDGNTYQWALIIRHPSKSLFRIAKHPNYTSDELTLKTELTDDWNEQL